MRTVSRICASLMLTGLISLSAHAQELQEVQEIRDGMVLNANAAFADGAEFSGQPALMLLHGTLAHKDMELIQTMQRALAERGINSLAPSLSYRESDRRGMYNCEQTMMHRDDDAEGEITFWKDWLLNKGANTIILMGHSRGGRQIANFAAENPFDNLSHVVLLAPATFNAEAAAGNFFLTHGKPLAPLLEQAASMEPDDILLGVGSVYCKGVDVTAEAFLSYNTPSPRRDTPTVVTNIDKPVLVVAGSKDTTVRNLIPAMEKIADDNEIKLTVIEDADHFFLDFFAEDAADAIADFINN